MKCDDARVEAYADGEIPAWRRFAYKRHLAICPACAARFAEARSMSDRIRREVPRFAAPDSVRAKILALADGPAPRAPSRPSSDRRWRWAGAGALAGSLAGSLVTVVVLLAGSLALDRRSGEDIAAAAVAAHVRATLSHELIQVASS